MRQLSTRLFKIPLSQRLLRKSGSYRSGGGGVRGSSVPALLLRWEFRGLRPRCRSEDRRSWSRASSPRWEFRDLRGPRCRSEDRRSWSRASSRWAMGGSRTFPHRRSWSRASSRWAMGGSRPPAAMPVVGRPAFLVPRFFAVGDGRFATSGRDAGRKTGVPGPALLRGGRWEVRDLRPRCRSEDRRSWSRASSRWAMGGSRPPAAMPVGRPAFLVPRFFAVGDGRFATSGRDAGRKTGAPGPALLRGGRWEVRDLRPRCRSEDRRSWSRASSRWAMGGSRPAAAMPV